MENKVYIHYPITQIDKVGRKRPRVVLGKKKKLTDHLIERNIKIR